MNFPTSFLQALIVLGAILFVFICRPKPSVLLWVRIFQTFALVTGMLFPGFALPTPVHAAGIDKEYFIPGSTDQLFKILQDNDNDPELGDAFGVGVCTAAPCNRMHNLIDRKSVV